jgi:hypothetical protein
VDPHGSQTERYAQPAEWAPHEAVWVAWPSAEDLWKEDLVPAQRAFTAMCAAIADLDPETRRPRGERLELLVPDEECRRAAMRALEGLAPRAHTVPFGDIWLRDTAPIFLLGPRGAMRAASFAFNGWGGKYVLPHDDRVAARIAAISGARATVDPRVLEGGSVEVDGEGTLLTTQQCLLHPNRNHAPASVVKDPMSRAWQMAEHVSDSSASSAPSRTKLAIIASRASATRVDAALKTLMATWRFQMRCIPRYTTERLVRWTTSTTRYLPSIRVPTKSSGSVSSGSFMGFVTQQSKGDAMTHPARSLSSGRAHESHGAHSQ